VGLAVDIVIINRANNAEMSGIGLQEVFCKCERKGPLDDHVVLGEEKELRVTRPHQRVPCCRHAAVEWQLKVLRRMGIAELDELRFRRLFSYDDGEFRMMAPDRTQEPFGQRGPRDRGEDQGRPAHDRSLADHPGSTTAPRWPQPRDRNEAPAAFPRPRVPPAGAA